MKARTFAQRQKDKPSKSYPIEGHQALFVQALREGKSLTLSTLSPDTVHIEEINYALPHS